MKHMVAGLLAGVWMLGAQAATRVDTDAFSMQYMGGNAAGEIHLLSAGDGRFQIALDSLGNDLSGWSASGVMEAIDNEGVLVSHAASTAGSFAFDVASGYRITGLTWSGFVYGGWEAAWHDGRTGIATSALNLAWTGSANGVDTPFGAIDFQDLAGGTMLSFSLPPELAYDGDFALAFAGSSSATAQGIVYLLPDGTPQGVTSIASVGLHDMVLTVEVSPVPEPQAWAMLLAGCAGLGVVARRKR